MNVLRASAGDQISHANEVMARYHKRHKPHLNPSSIMCKRNAIWLGQSVETHVQGVNVALGKVSRVKADNPLIHKVGGDYNYHYVVVLTSDVIGVQVLDPMLFTEFSGAIPADEYLVNAFNTPDNGRLEVVGPIPR